MRLLLVSAIFLGVASLFFIFREPQTTHQVPLPSDSPTVTPSLTPLQQSMDIRNAGKTYRIAWVKLRDLSKLTLIPNFTEKRTARSLVDNKECAEVVNGGFYTKDNQPTGLFVTEGKTIRGNVPNTLLNGYVVIDKNNNAVILVSPPDAFVRIALQTGPILVRNGKAVTLTIRDDEFARRAAVGIMQKGTVIFLTVYDPENIWSGPKLADTPDVLSDVLERLQLTDALNLDGGSASAFIRSDLSLQELSSVGSFFCIRKGY